MVKVGLGVDRVEEVVEGEEGGFGGCTDEKDAMRSSSVVGVAVVVGGGKPSHTDANVLEELVIVAVGGLDGIEGRFLFVNGLYNRFVELTKEVLDGVTVGRIKKPTFGDAENEGSRGIGEAVAAKGKDAHLGCPSAGGRGCVMIDEMVDNVGVGRVGDGNEAGVGTNEPVLHNAAVDLVPKVVRVDRTVREGDRAKGYVEIVVKLDGFVVGRRMGTVVGDVGELEEDGFTKAVVGEGGTEDFFDGVGGDDGLGLAGGRWRAGDTKEDFRIEVHGRRRKVGGEA